MSKQHYILIAGLAFLMSLVSMYFGASIFNANDNFLIEHLNEMDKIHYYDVEDVPALSRLACIVTAPFILAILVLEIIGLRKTTITKSRRLLFTNLFFVLALIILSVLVLKNPYFFDFSQWGFAWIFSGLAIIVSAMLRIFIKA